MKIYLVRHGQCESNVIGRYNFVNEDINEVGIKQAENLRDIIKNINYDIIISSPLKRALHTAHIININNKKIITDDRLVERKHGSLEGKSIGETNREDYWNYYTNNRYGTEESIPNLCYRVKEFLDELKNKKYEDVLIVAHSGVSKAFYVYFNGIPKDGKLLNFGLKNTEIKEYELD
ncbi:MAG: histidine phosphatase family protein [Bacilli bacterium]|nr:histidine phosphatase family protein [Bacilli bacterium]